MAPSDLASLAARALTPRESRYAAQGGKLELSLRGSIQANDPHHVTIEGQRVVDDEPTTDEQPVIVRTVTVEITDGRLSMVIGGRSESTGEYAYTFVGFLTIEPVD